MLLNARNIVPLGILAALLASLLWAVSFGTLPPADYTFSNNTEIKTIDPAIVTGAPEGRVIRGLFEGLVNWDPEDLHPTPGVAESWEISDDQLTYTFNIREDALWSDGSEMTADDFVYSFRRFLHPKTAAEYAYQLFYVDRAQDYTEANIKIGDRVEVELREKPEGALPDAPGVTLHGTLVDIQPPLPAEQLTGDETVAEEDPGVVRTYTVEIDGKRRLFRKLDDPTQKADDGAEDYAWLLLDFDEVAIHALNKRQLEIKLESSTPYFLSLLGFYPLFPVNQTCVETYPFPEWTKPENLVCNGPFLLESRRIRDRIRMVKNPLYWNRENIHFNVVDVLAVQSETTALNMYLTGQMDRITQVPATITPELLAQDRPDFKPYPFFGTYYYRINTTRPPLDNPLVRKALSMAIDREEIVEKVTKAGQKPSLSFVPPGVQGYTRAACEGFDPEQARKLLAEAGYEDGEGFSATFEIMYNTNEVHKAIAELIQSQWKKHLGIDVKLQNQEWAVYLSNSRQMKYWVARAAWIGDYLDPNTFLDMFVTDGANNQTGWSNKEYDRLIEEAAREHDPAARMQIMHDAEAILMDELPVIPIYNYVTTGMARPYVKGFYPNVQDVHPYVGMKIDQQEKQRVLESEGLR